MGRHRLSGLHRMTSSSLSDLALVLNIQNEVKAFKTKASVLASGRCVEQQVAHRLPCERGERV